MGDNSKQSLYGQLYDSRIKSPLNGRWFLPLDVLHGAITRARVEEAVPIKTSKLSAMLRGGKKKSDIHEKIVQNPKLFSILVLTAKASNIKELLEAGLTDKDLPLKRDKSPGLGDSFVSSRGTTLNFFTTVLGVEGANMFIDNQWTVLAPIIDSTGQHFELHEYCALPVKASDPVGSGLSGIVHMSELHPAHQTGLQIQNNKYQVAVKEFKIINTRDKDKDSGFRKEKRNLELIKTLGHPHMIQYHATCEAIGPTGGAYYVIFPFADGGDLWDYWDRTCSCEIEETWILKQMLGLTGGLAALHAKGIRHGDLKPGNILLFNSEEDPTLVIGDVGISRHHRVLTVDRKKGTTTKATTPSYQAPEVDGDPSAPRPRTYDVWSLGCIFLEFTIWYLHDFNAVLAFLRARSGFGSDERSYFYEPHGNKQVAIHPHVTDVISFLLEDPRCAAGTPLGMLIALISDGLLVLDPKKRTKAKDVATKLESIVNASKMNESHVDSPAVETRPFIFTLPQESKQVPYHSRQDSFMQTYTRTSAG